ncbi:MAG: undecaprenyl-diphosphate phosphatase [Polyangiaceae bacterium]
MTPFIAFLLGLVEGLTEFLPVSSTGHLTLTCHLLGVPKELADTYDVVVQIGAILAVAIHYRAVIAKHLSGLFRREAASLKMALSLGIASVPTVVIGVLFRKAIKKYLFGPLPVAIALAVGGVAMIVIDRAMRSRARKEDVLEDVTPKRAAIIGLGQCFSLVPGTSRSMVTIVAGQLSGLTAKTAAEFTFLLGLPILGGASIYEAYKDRVALAQIGGLNLAIGLVTAFFVGWAAIAGFIRYLSKNGLAPFGVYRIVLAAVTLALLYKPA